MIDDFIILGPMRIYLAPTDAPVDVLALDPCDPCGQEWWIQIAGPKDGKPFGDGTEISGGGYSRKP